MKKFSPQVLAAAAALAMPTFAFSAGTVPITFDMNGAASGQVYSVDLLDWLPGNALAIGGTPTSGAITAGTQTQLLYQANLGVVSLGGAAQATAGLGGALNFTAVAGFKEIVTSNAGGFNPNFGFNDAPVLSSTNFFYIYANTFGNNLAGTGFVGGTGPILSGHVISVSSSNFSTTGAIDVLDQNGNNDYPGAQTLVGTGATNITVLIDQAMADYFPGLVSGGTLTFSFFNNSQVTPFNQVDPSACFSSDGISTACLAAGFAGANNINGVADGVAPKNFIFQADANQSFNIVPVPEPGSLALVGLALGGLGFVASRKGSKA